MVIILAHATHSANSGTFQSHFNSVAQEQGTDGKLTSAWFGGVDAELVVRLLIILIFVDRADDD